MISTDNDPVMEKFTNHMLPETQFRGHHDEHKISSHAQQGDGATVWQTMSRKSMMWNPEQNFGKAKDNVQKKGTYFSGLHRGSSSEQYHLSMNVAPDKTIILGL